MLQAAQRAADRRLGGSGGVIWKENTPAALACNLDCGNRHLLGRRRERTSTARLSDHVARV